MPSGSEGHSRTQERENVPPGSSGVGKTLRSSSSRLFKAHSKKKSPQDQPQPNPPLPTGQDDNSGINRLFRRSSNASQIALRCLKGLRNGQGVAPRGSDLDLANQHSVRFDLSRNKNHCYEDENYMYNNRQHRAPYDYPGGAGYGAEEGLDEYYYYYQDEEDSSIDEMDTNPDEVAQAVRRPGDTQEDTHSSSDSSGSESDKEVALLNQQHQGSPQYAVLVDMAMPPGSNPSGLKLAVPQSTVVDRASISTDEFCNECQGRVRAQLDVDAEQPCYACVKCASLVSEDRQPIAATYSEMSCYANATVRTPSEYDHVAPESERTFNIEDTSEQPVHPKKRKSSGDYGNEVDAGVSAKRMFIKTNAEQQSEIEHRIEHLRAEIQKEEAIERQAVQALDLCQQRSARNSDEEFAAERLLLLAGIKVGKCQSELKQLLHSSEEGGVRRQASDSSVIFNPLKQRPCVATVHLSDICLPLHLGFLASLGREGVGQFLVAARCGSDVVASTHVKSTRQAASLSSGIVFDEALTLERVYCDAQIEIEVYYFTTSSKSKDESGTPLASTPTKSRLMAGDGQRTLSSSKKPGRGLKAEYLSSPMKSPMNASSMPRMSRFQLAASSSLSLQGLQKHTQIKLQEWSGQHVVFGHIFATVMGKAHFEEHQHGGFLTWKEELDGIPNWRRLWCDLSGTLIKAWQYPSDKNTKDPVKVLDLGEYSRKKYSLRVDVADQDVVVRKYTLILAALPPRKISKDVPEPELETHVFSADSKLECTFWVDAFRRTVEDLETWQSLPRRYEENVEHNL